MDAFNESTEEDRQLQVLDLQREKRQLEARVRELTSEVSDFEEQQTLNEEEIQKLKGQVSTLKTEKRQLEFSRDDNSSQDREDALRKRISELEAELNEEREKCVQINMAKKNLALGLQEAQSKYDQEVSEATLRNRQMRRLQNRVKLVEDERSELERQIIEASTAKANFEQRLRTTETALHASEDNLEMMCRRKEKLEKELEEYAHDANIAVDHLRCVTAERDRLLETYHILEESTTATETKLKQVEEKLAATALSRDYFGHATQREKERRHKVYAELIHSEDECVRLRRLRRNLEEETDDLKFEVSKCRSENDSLQRKLNEMRQSSSSLSPFGSFATLSESRLDLTSRACSSSEWSIHMRETSELDARLGLLNGNEEEKESFSVSESSS